MPLKWIRNLESDFIQQFLGGILTQNSYNRQKLRSNEVDAGVEVGLKQAGS